MTGATIERTPASQHSVGINLVEQTPLVTGSRLGGLLRIDHPREPLLNFAPDTGTSAGTYVWQGLHNTPATEMVPMAAPTTDWVGLLSIISSPETPLVLTSDVELTWQRTIGELVFAALQEQWRALLSGPIANQTEHRHTPQAESSSPAWKAFAELAGWLRLTDAEATDLLGLGRKTPYGWRRTGHEPQPRLARRLYEAHAFVRQMVQVFDESEAARLIHQGGDNSPASLIAANRVAEAEARFGSVLYARPRRSEIPIEASVPGDDDRSVALEPEVQPKPGGRRRVQPRHRS